MCPETSQSIPGMRVSTIPERLRLDMDHGVKILLEVPVALSLSFTKEANKINLKTYVCVCVCVYIYIYRERERERERVQHSSGGEDRLPTVERRRCGMKITRAHLHSKASKEP